MQRSYPLIFMCEHWLTVSETAAIKDCFKDKWVYFKSSMCPEDVISGRPYGGVGFVCDQIAGLDYKIIEIDCDRICAMEIIRKNVVILTVIGVYLPYCNQTVNQMELYLEVLDKVKYLLEDIVKTGPVVMLGDMNTNFPQNQQIANNWHKLRPFSKQSAILYELLCEYDLCVANFAYSQKVNYTYYKEVTRSYIDHIIIPKYCVQMLDYCKILSDAENNVSEDMAISAAISISTGKSDEHIESVLGD